MNLIVLVAVTLAAPHMASDPTADLLAISAAVRPAEPKFSFMSAQKEARLRALLPQIDDRAMSELLADDHLLLYTEEEMPRAYQFWDGMFPGVHSPNYNISANNSEPFGNGNREFPWGSPAGTHRTSDLTSFRFLSLPRGADGKQLPVVWYRRALTGDGRMGYAWTFPKGAVLGEVLCLRGPDGKDYAFELRIRRREVNDWGVDVFRPFPATEDLAERIKELRPGWYEQEKLARFVSYLAEPRELPSMRLVDQQPGQRAFEQRMGLDTLPALDDDMLVTELLTTTPFRSALGATWRFGTNGQRTAAPTTDAKFHIVPASYDAGFVDVDRVSCVRCHETVNQSVNRFNAGRDWYGRIRGSDGIFSFHPFSHGSISGNGYVNSVSMRGDMQTAGLLQRYDPKKHPAENYTKIEYLTE
ncbi:MAG: hypothetical protein KF708_04090 [Pirellulales bacterium]|nr:hypothetical protein [Pirellulales bacterium]